MASTKLRDPKNDYLKPISTVKVEPPIVAVPVEAPVEIVTAPPIDPFVASPPAAKKSMAPFIAGFIASALTVGIIGYYAIWKESTRQAKEDIYLESVESEVPVTVAAEAADAAEVAALESIQVAENSDEELEAPLVTIGSYWNYRVVDYVNPKNSYNHVNLTVSDVTDDGYIMVKDWIGTEREASMLWYDKELNLESGAVADYSPALAYYKFPLYEGKTWESDSRVDNHKYNINDRIHFSGRVIGWESISSPAWNDVRALRIEVEIVSYKDGAIVGRDLDVSWYEPKVGRAIKTLEYKWNDASGGYGDPQRMQYIFDYNIS